MLSASQWLFSKGLQICTGTLIVPAPLKIFYQRTFKKRLWPFNIIIDNAKSEYCMF